jgi:transposase, IS5 family
MHCYGASENEDKQLAPTSTSRRKVTQLYFEVKAHIGVDSQAKVILTATPVNVHDSMCLPDLLSLGCFIYLAIL